MSTKNLVSFNINQFVYFVPTEYGLNKMNEYFNFRNGQHNVDEETGFHYLQMHEFMACFGDIAFVGNDNFVAYSEVYFDSNYLGCNDEPCCD